MSAKPAVILPSAVLINGRVYDALLQPDGAGCVIVQPLHVPDMRVDIPMQELENILATLKQYKPPRVEGW